MIICELKRRFQVMHINIVLIRVKVKGVKVEYKDKSGTVASSIDRYTVETKVEHETTANIHSLPCARTRGGMYAGTGTHMQCTNVSIRTVGRETTNTVCLQCLALNVKNCYAFLFIQESKLGRFRVRVIVPMCVCL